MVVPELSTSGTRGGDERAAGGAISRGTGDVAGAIDVGDRETDAVIGDVPTAVAQALEIALRRRVETRGGPWIPLPARTICVHGDGVEAAALLREIRRALEAADFTIRA